MASWCCGRVSDSRSRGRGFESRPGTAAYTYVPLPPSSIIWYRRKLGSKQARYTSPVSVALQHSWCLAEGYRNGDQRRLMGPCGSGRTLLFLHTTTSQSSPDTVRTVNQQRSIHDTARFGCHKISHSTTATVILHGNPATTTTKTNVANQDEESTACSQDSN